MLLAALALSTVAVLVALLMPSAPPLRAQIRSGEGGTEVIDVSCDSCPDGTVLRVREAEATVQAGRATIPLGQQFAEASSSDLIRVEVLGLRHTGGSRGLPS